MKGWTIRGAVSVLSGILQEAVEQGVLAANPVQKVSRKKREKVSDETPKRILTVTEIELLLATAARRGTRWAVLVSLGLHAGLRLGEALGLTWNDVDLDAGVIRVRRQLDSQTGELRELKTKAAKRDIPISSALRTLLLEWKLESLYALADDPVVSTATGVAVSHRNGLRTLVEIAVACGINVPAKDETDERPNLDFHSLRHTFASAMIKATKGDAEKVRRWMGHADSKVLLERYSHEFESVRGGRQDRAGHRRDGCRVRRLTGGPPSYHDRGHAEHKAPRDTARTRWLGEGRPTRLFSRGSRSHSPPRSSGCSLACSGTRNPTAGCQGGGLGS